MVIAKSLAKRSVAVITALTLSVVAVLPLVTSSADAAQVTSRKIQMGKSQASATDTTYMASFSLPSTANVGGLVITFCSNSPIIGVACTAPAGMAVNPANGLVIANVTGLSGFTKDAATDANTLVYTNATPQSITGPQAVTLDLGAGGASDGVTNPSTTGSFYARIITFSTQANAQAYSDASATVPTGAVDYGGVALSTNAVITVTALVQETLNFVVTGTSVTMGTGTPQVIDDTQEWISTAVNMDIDTNATTGLNIRLYGTHLLSGANSLSGNGTLGVLTGTAGSQFGICTKDSTNTQVVADAQYETGAANCTTAGTSTFAWDNAATSAVGGDTVYTSTGPVDNDVNSNVDVYYAARADNNVPAGQYQAQHQLIATGTF
jgi:hypothetical protein